MYFLLLSMLIYRAIRSEFWKYCGIFVPAMRNIHTNYPVERPKLFGRAVSWLFLIALTCVWLSSCRNHSQEKADKFNDIAYHYHYRNLDSTATFARRALAVASSDDACRAEALNHLAFVSIMRMDYPMAKKLCDSVQASTSNQIELLVSDIQQMRICQRESRNKHFYDAYQQAGQRLRRIAESSEELTPRQKRRMVYAQTEYQIVASSYFYYVGLERQSAQAVVKAGEVAGLDQDTAQLINFCYNYGSGGVLTQGTREEINQQEFDYLMRAYRLALQSQSTFWIANTLQALSEHLQQRPDGERLMADNPRDIRQLNTDSMPDSLLAGNLAERSLQFFRKYGDIYQTAGSLRTLANCYWQIGDYTSALLCLQQALEEDTLINRAPDLVASIREQLCLVYSAVDDKQSSDYNRNLYLDLQDQTRQDRYYEARADQLDRTSHTLNLILGAVVMMIVVVVGLLILFAYMRNRGGSKATLLSPLYASLRKWQQKSEAQQLEMTDRFEELQEQLAVSKLRVEASKRRNLEQRAKISLINSVLPLLDRMLLEIKHLATDTETPTLRAERTAYLQELVQQVNATNVVLTEWIKLRQGSLSVRIESFPLQPIFDLVAKAQPEFNLKGIQLVVHPTTVWAKADRVLTLFMVNTLADNARKYTLSGGKVTLLAQDNDDYVEVSVTDTGCGMTEEQLKRLFEYHPISDEQLSQQTVSTESHSHGFGLMNCKGIINHYRKLSQLFSVCTLQAESISGKGSRFFFRLPKGIACKTLSLLLLLSYSLWGMAAPVTPTPNQFLQQASLYADSAYHSNIDGTYPKTLDYADSCCTYLNHFYQTVHPQGRVLISLFAQNNIDVPEVRWLRDSIPTNYEVILSMRNEAAVAALALHQWDIYRYNNKAYTQLFKESSADNTLPSYCVMMQRSEDNKQVAITVLILLLLSIAPAFYFIYYRHRISFLLNADQVRQLVEILLSDAPLTKKMQAAEVLRKSPLPSPLGPLVEQICAALRASADVERKAQERLLEQEEQLHRFVLEDERLHLSNSTLDNSLSALKHETMYYPSRIAQLLSERDVKISDIQELAAYYRELYHLLCLQTMKQLALIPLSGRPIALDQLFPRDTIVGQWPDGGTTDGAKERVLGDADMLCFLFEILRKQNGNQPLTVEIALRGTAYIVLRVPIDRMDESEQEVTASLFSPSMANLPYLLCSQIVRDNGELTHRRGCGIEARRFNNKTYLIITLARWNNLK